MKKIAILLAAGLLAAGPAVPCGATSGFCVCVRPQSAQYGLESAEAVFRGVVTKSSPIPVPADRLRQSMQNSM